MIDSSPIRERFAALSRHLSEGDRRLWAASEARAAGYGGIAAVSAATGIAASTIGRGLKELASADTLDVGRVRRRGGGRQPLVKKDATLLADLLALVDPSARGDPMSPLRWTCKSLSQLAAALAAKGHRVGRTVVGELLHQQKFSLQANRKTREGDSHPDRDAQFVHINDTVAAALAAGEPVISVDTKKKELVGDFKNAGREWRPAGQPQDVRVHDFLIKELGRAVPYGVYDLADDAGWVSVGMDHDTSAFAVQSIRRWWAEVGRPRYPKATRLVITADGGGSNGSRVPLVETRITTPRQRTGPRHRRPSPAAGDQQMEQDRAPPFLVHHHEPESSAAHQLPRDRRPDQRHDDQDRPYRPLRTGQQRLSQGSRRVRPGNRRDQHHARCIPRRMELHD
jgi:Rhodopirellula transposase DDE domain